MYVLSLVVLALTPRHRLPVINRFMLGILATEPENTLREITNLCGDFLTPTHKSPAETLIRSEYSQVHTDIPTQKFW